MTVSIKNYTLGYLSIALFLLVTIWAVIFYFVISDEVYETIDDGLQIQKREIIAQAFQEDDLLEIRDFGSGQFRITPIQSSDFQQYNEFYNQEFLVDDDYEDFRVLKTSFYDENRNAYRLEIRTSTVEEDNLAYNIFLALGILYFVLIVSIFIINHWVLNKALKPFKTIISKLENHQFGDETTFTNQATKVKEFKVLGQKIDEMMQRNQETYLQQKTFIENVSHELQTPIAIVRNKLDWMIENENFSTEQLQELSGVKSTINRMNQLNASLLMLTKIENQQFKNTDLVNLNSIIKLLLEDFEDLMEYKEIDFKLEENAQFELFSNHYLMEILCSNLMRNAIKYTAKKGEIRIVIQQNEIQFWNSASEKALNSAKIFDRFYKNSTDVQSTGLGLAIVKSIVEQQNELSIIYRFDQNFHVFSLEN